MSAIQGPIYLICIVQWWANFSEQSDTSVRYEKPMVRIFKNRVVHLNIIQYIDRIVNKNKQIHNPNKQFNGGKCFWQTKDFQKKLFIFFLICSKLPRTEQIPGKEPQTNVYMYTLIEHVRPIEW